MPWLELWGHLKSWTPADISLMLYKAYVLPHFEYCSPLLFAIGINKTLNKRLESANYYALKVQLKIRKQLRLYYYPILSAVNKQSPEHRRCNQSLVLLFKYIEDNGPNYDNLRNSEHNPPYNNRYYQTCFTYQASHFWNQLSSYIKRSAELETFNSGCFMSISTKVSLSTCPQSFSSEFS